MEPGPVRLSLLNTTTTVYPTPATDSRWRSLPLFSSRAARAMHGVPTVTGASVLSSADGTTTHWTMDVLPPFVLRVAKKGTSAVGDGEATAPRSFLPVTPTRGLAHQLANVAKAAAGMQSLLMAPSQGLMIFPHECLRSHMHLQRMLWARRSSWRRGLFCWASLACGGTINSLLIRPLLRTSCPTPGGSADSMHGLPAYTHHAAPVPAINGGGKMPTVSLSPSLLFDCLALNVTTGFINPSKA
jgi:hypothetical protein